MALPAFLGGLPGGVEIVILVLNLVLLAAVAYAVYTAIRALGGTADSDLEARVANLEGQVEALREELKNREE